MTENQAVDTLLSAERDICGRIHSTVTEILRKGYENGGKEQLKNMIESIRYNMDTLEAFIERMG